MILYDLVFWELIICWLVWCYIPIFRAPHNQKRPSVTAHGPTVLGLLFEIASYVVAVSVREPAGAIPWIRLLAAALAAPVGVAVMWSAVAHLGRQFRINAGLYADHELVRTGPYSTVRHPIYASMMLMLLGTSMMGTRWPWMLVAFALFLIGTEIRVRTEDRLLASRFGEQFTAYRRQVAAYIPFVR
jgi:protein-S-isoprenylcysteine O-methyltransferase Ste14